jgi:hypothetical protein
VPNGKVEETGAPAVSRSAAGYRLWVEDGTLLYVGSAYDPAERAKAHCRTARRFQ